MTGALVILATAALGAAACSSSASSSASASAAGGTQAAGGGGSSCAGAHKKLHLAFVYTTTSLNPFQEMALGAEAAAPPPGTQVTTFVGNSNYQIGVALGNAFVARHPDPNGEVVLGIDIPALSVLQQRMKGVEAVIRQKLPHMKIIGPLDSQNSPTDTYNAWASFASAYPKAVGFIGVGGVDGVALPEIMKKTGRRFLAGSADVPPAALLAVKDGYLFALSSPEHWMKGYIAMKLLIDAARTCKPMPAGWWNTGNLLITSKNIDSILARQVNNQTRFAWFDQQDIPRQLANPPIEPLSDAN